MREKIINRILVVSIALIGTTTAITSISSLAGFVLPDAVMRLIGGVNLVSLAVTGYTTAQKIRSAASKTLHMEASQMTEGGSHES